LKEAKKPEFRDTFMDFVRKLEKEGKAGPYIIRFKKVIRSGLKFNGINTVLDVNIANENVNLTIMDERVPTKEELSKLIRIGSARGREAISMFVFSGLRTHNPY
ncbi:MAG: site-specific integrase, partial [Nitrososphaeria archaeon]